VDMSGVLQAVDRWSFLLVNHTLQNPAFDRLMPLLSDKRAGLILVAALVPFLCFRWGRREWPTLAVAICAVALSDQGATFLKDIFQRTRPCHVIADVHLLSGCTSTFSLPSGHASNMFALVGAAWAARARWRWPVLILAIGVACSRVYLGVHYPGDVILGAAWGAAIGWTLMQGAHWLLPDRWLARGMNPPDPAPAAHPSAAQ
jgi:undecaprenyl-diphosphatase